MMETRRINIAAFISAIILAGSIRIFLIQAYKIPAGSMTEALQIGDHILVDKLHYGIRIPITGQHVLKFQEPRRGDIIVFIYPVDPSKDFIKRVIGEPGDTVEVKDKRLIINGEPFNDPYGHFVEGTGNSSRLTPRDNFGPVTVPHDGLFVLGDNRDRSYDSRFWGFVPLDDVRGKAWIIYWSWDRDNDRLRWERIGSLIQ